MKILVVESDPALSRHFREILEPLGYHFSIMSPPAGGIEELHEIAPDLAILGPTLVVSTSGPCVRLLDRVEARGYPGMEVAQ